MSQSQDPGLVIARLRGEISKYDRGIMTFMEAVGYIVAGLPDAASTPWDETAALMKDALGGRPLFCAAAAIEAGDPRSPADVIVEALEALEEEPWLAEEYEIRAFVAAMDDDLLVGLLAALERRGVTGLYADIAVARNGSSERCWRGRGSDSWLRPMAAVSPSPLDIASDLRHIPPVLH